MELAYLELLRPWMILIMLAMAATAVVVFALLGPVGTFEALTPLQRLLCGTLYAVICWPIGYSMCVVTFYFMRFRSPLEVALGLTLVLLFTAIPCTAVVHTVETLVQPDYTAAGLGRVYVLVATTGVADGLLVVYLVYQRVKHASALAAAAAEVEQVAEAVTHEGTDEAAAADGAADEAAADRPVDEAAADRPVDEAAAGKAADEAAADKAANEAAAGKAADEAPDKAADEAAAEKAADKAAAEAPDGPVSTVAAAETGTSSATARAKRSAPDDSATGVGDRESDESRGRSNGAMYLTPRTRRNQARARRMHRRVTYRRSDGTPRGRFLGQLPPELGDDVIYLKSEDHYVHVCTMAGSSLIKMRFADAIVALGDTGIRAHRSYWVALDHLRELANRDRRLVVRLSGHHEVPVSARYLPAVRAALKLPPQPAD